MKIYAIDDKRTEIAKAEEVIEKNGHEYHLTRNMLSLYRKSVCKFNEDLSYEKSDSAQTEIFRAVKEMKKVGGGIITDMMFHLTPPLKEDDPIPPSGLLVVIQCLAAGVPVVVCTDASEVGGHHAQALHWIFDGYVRPARDNESLPFGWIENKDWDAAVKLLEQIHAQQQEKGGDK